MVGERKIYHITHVENLVGIIRDGAIFSEHRLITEGRNPIVIGMDHIKERRLRKRVTCHPPLTVGEFVPFYFCARSVMLYVIDKRHSELVYRGGQREIVHLVSDVSTAIEAAAGRAWAFSDGNASAAYTTFSKELDQLQIRVDWTAIAATDWRDPAVKDKKQAEFLVHDFFPWSAVRMIGVHDPLIERRVREILGGVSSQVVSVQPSWYY